MQAAAGRCRARCSNARTRLTLFCQMRQAKEAYLVLALHALNVDLQVQLAHAANDGLPALPIHAHLCASICFSTLAESVARGGILSSGDRLNRARVSMHACAGLYMDYEQHRQHRQLCH